jgi:hypothetical protein
MRAVFAILTTVTIATSAAAQSTPKTDLILYGVATKPCGTFLVAQEAQGQEYGYYISWLQGYLSAMNIYSVLGRQDTGKGKDIQSMLIWLRQECEKRPLQDFTLSVIKLVGELKQ